MTAAPPPPVASIVEQGKLLDYIDRHTQRKETPEEYVRQEIAKSLVTEYGYPRPNIAVEFTVRVGTRKPRADLVIFPADTEHEQAAARLIVECKSPKIKASAKKDGVEQLQSYMSVCPNVTYGMWTNGAERYCYKRTDTDGSVTFDEVPDLPTYGHTDAPDDQPTFDQLKPASSDALLFAFQRCHNYIAGNQGLQKSQAFWEFLKLIFCKIHDEHHSNEVTFYASAAERHGEAGPKAVKRRIDALFAAVRAEFPNIFAPNEAIQLNPSVLAYIVQQLQMYALLESDIDVKGRAYETIVGSNLRGDRGEFFTPRNICQMAVEMLDPGEKHRIADPACGTGGFLITAMNHVVAKITNAVLETRNGDYTKAAPVIETRSTQFVKNYIFGLDFNPELVKASKMNMVMNNDGAGGLYQANSLERPVKPTKDAAFCWPDDVRALKLPGTVDRLFTNPPFGSKIPITEPLILKQYDLGHTWSYDKDADRWKQNESLASSQPPEILFIERCVQLLKPAKGDTPGGRMAIVLPDGILGSPGLGYVRQWLLTYTKILASIDLHPDTFQPFVSVQTSLLVLERKDPALVDLERAAGRLNDYDVFMAVANHIGHDKRGNDTYVRDEHGNEIVKERQKEIVETVDGVKTRAFHTVTEKVRDDNTQQIAQAFKQWLNAQD